MNKDYKFVSVLAPYIQGLIEQKRASGFSYKDSAYMLGRFDRFCESYGLSVAELPRGLVMDWQPNVRMSALPHGIIEFL